jgi:MAF protein
VVLASGSPRRRELIALAGWDITLHPVDVDETPMPGEGAAALTRRLALAKAEAAFKSSPPGSIVVAADTIVADDDGLLGKPGDDAAALAMLHRLRRGHHTVVTSLAVFGPNGTGPLLDACSTEVPMRDYGDDEIQRFVASGSAADKAGAYGIQESGFHPVEVTALHGCFANVMGLPLCHLVRTLRRRGLEPRVDVPSACRAHTDYDCPVYAAILQGEA